MRGIAGCAARKSRGLTRTTVGEAISLCDVILAESVEFGVCSTWLMPGWQRPTLEVITRDMYEGAAAIRRVHISGVS